MGENQVLFHYGDLNEKGKNPCNKKTTLGYKAPGGFRVLTCHLSFLLDSISSPYMKPHYGHRL